MNRVLMVLMAMVALIIAGCGGSGNGGSSSGGNAAVFITDDLTTGYDHVWVTIKSISVGKVGGGSTVVYSDPNGAAVDLRALRDDSGPRFKFLAFADGLSGQYNSVTVVLDDDVVLYPTGATTGLNRTFEGSVGGEKSLTANFDAKTFGPGNDDLVIDFDLSKWNDNGSQVTDAQIRVLTDDSGLNDDSRHDQRSYPGTVSNLNGTAPNQTFTLTHGNHSVQVQLNADTRIDRSDDDSNPVLANGIHVVVRGTFDVDTNRLVADRVQITGQSEDDNDEAFGTATNLDAVAGSLDLTVTSAEGFIPQANPIHVTSNGTTTYRNAAGVLVTRAEFFALLTLATRIEVEGQYDSGTNTMLAAKMKIDDDGDDEEAEIRGSTSNVSAIDGTFVVTVSSFSGINISPGAQIHVATDAETAFRPLEGGGTITQAQFFAALLASPGQLVEVEGTWDGSILHADMCKLED